MACSGCGKRRREFLENIQNQNKITVQNKSVQNNPSQQQLTPLTPPKSDRHTRAMARHLRAIARAERIRLRNERAKLKAQNNG